MINLSSGAAAAPLPFAGLYAGSKAYLEAASFALRRELIAFGIKVSVLRLGKVASTRFGRTTAAAQISEPYTRIHEHIERTLFDAIWPSGQAWPTAESIASTIVTILNLENPEALYELGEELARLYSTASVVPGKLD